MAKKEQLIAQSFRETIVTVFAFLISDFGFSLSDKSDDYLIVYEGQDCKVRIFDEWGDIIVTLSPTFPSPLTGMMNTYGFGLKLIITCLAPASESEFKNVSFNNTFANYGGLS